MIINVKSKITLHIQLIFNTFKKFKFKSWQPFSTRDCTFKVFWMKLIETLINQFM